MNDDYNLRGNHYVVAWIGEPPHLLTSPGSPCAGQLRPAGPPGGGWQDVARLLRPERDVRR